MKKKEQKKCERVNFNLIQAECYVRYPERVTADGQRVKKYTELQQKTVENGIIEEYVEVDYPITLESVNSYADSADYRRNPQVILDSQNSKRSNLGDITDMQRILQEDTAMVKEVVSRMGDISAKLDEYAKTKNAQKQPTDKVDNRGENNG